MIDLHKETEMYDLNQGYLKLSRCLQNGFRYGQSLKWLEEDFNTSTSGIFLLLMGQLRMYCCIEIMQRVHQLLLLTLLRLFT